MKIGTILYKVLMAITGLAWFGFLIGHLAGNFQLFQGAEPFNHYAKFLESLGGLLIIAELGLVVFIVTHIGSALKLTYGINGPARQTGYAERKNRGQSSFASRTMIIGGILIAVFIVLHVAGFKYGLGQPALSATPGELYGRVYSAFQKPLVVGFYVLVLAFLGLHLSHGIASALQTLGAMKGRSFPQARKLGLLVGWAIAVGFMIFPIAGIAGLLPSPDQVSHKPEAAQISDAAHQGALSLKEK